MQQMTRTHGRTRDKNCGFCSVSPHCSCLEILQPLFCALKNGKQEAHLSNSQPVGEVSGVGQGRGEAHHSDTLGGVGGDEVGPGHNDLQNWTPVLTWNTSAIPHTKTLAFIRWNETGREKIVASHFAGHKSRWHCSFSPNRWISSMMRMATFWT